MSFNQPLSLRMLSRDLLPFILPCFCREGNCQLLLRLQSWKQFWFHRVRTVGWLFGFHVLVLFLNCDRRRRVGGRGVEAEKEEEERGGGQKMVKRNGGVREERG